ncbi:MAG TPA: 2-amino-4-hydroxy-6-hydroxymethyldihydropteridine diphosphokinase [Bacteroidia bacterium]|nr:2-amino-4-hydroxy-6-hydroxymethyldihydropteridine diphosphokinase [Bacteroidia bacterium]
MEKFPVQTALMIGGNESDTKELFIKAIQLIEEKAGKITKKSSLYVSDPWGKIDQPDYLNQAVIVETHHNPGDLLFQLLEIENQLGRKRFVQNGPRTIDIDILFYKDLIINTPNLQIPHPRMHLRRFNLVPLNEIAPDWIHPIFKMSVTELLNACSDPLGITVLIK